MERDQYNHPGALNFDVEPSLLGTCESLFFGTLKLFHPGQ
jgi:hypothetical protein